MARPEKSHLQIIGWVHARKGAFSVREVHEATGFSFPQVRTVLQTLYTMGYLRKSAKAYKYRAWHKTPAWIANATLVEVSYEVYKNTLFGKQRYQKRRAIRGAN